MSYKIVQLKDGSGNIYPVSGVQNAPNATLTPSNLANIGTHIKDNFPTGYVSTCKLESSGTGYFGTATVIVTAYLSASRLYGWALLCSNATSAPVYGVLSNSWTWYTLGKTVIS